MKTQFRAMAIALATVMIFSSFGTNVALALETTETGNETAVETEAPAETVAETVAEPVEETGATDPIVSETSEETEMTEPVVSDNTEVTEAIEPTETTEPTVIEPTATEPIETSEEPVETTVPETVEEPVSFPAFDQSCTVAGTIVRVVAPEGVFPEGATLEVKAIDKLSNSVVIDREDSVLAESLVFDITVYDKDHNEIEPNGEVSVQFFNERFADTNLDTSVYHIDDNNNVTELDYNYIDTDGNACTENEAVAVEATTDGFSLYTVEFTYEALSYVLQGDSSVNLSEVLTSVGLVGEVTNVEISNPSFVSVENVNGTFVVRALKAFDTTERMTVTINGVDYVIVVTDDPAEEHTPQDAVVGTDAYAVLYDSNVLVFQKGNTAIEDYGNIVQSWEVKAFYDDPTTTSAVEKPEWTGDDYKTTFSSVIFYDNLKGMTDISGFFSNCTMTEVVNINRWDTSTVTLASGVFSGCTELLSIDISSFNTSHITNMTGLFNGAAKLETITANGFDLSAIPVSSGESYLTNFIAGWFGGCTSLKTITLQNWTNLPTQFNSAFGYAGGLSAAGCTLDVTGWNTSTVVSMSQCFAGGGYSTIIGLDTWNTANVTDMTQMFSGCTNLVTFDVTGFDTSHVTNMGGMFGNIGVETLDLSAWDTSSLTNLSYGNFAGGNKCKTLILDGWDLSHVTSFGGDWYGLETLSLRGAKLGNGMAGTLGRNSGGVNIKTLDVTDCDLSACTSLYGFFANLSALENLIGVNTWDTSSITNFSQTFNHVSAITTIDISAWDMSHATTVDQMFYMSDHALTTVVLPDSFTGGDHDLESICPTWIKDGENVNAIEIASGGTYTVDTSKAYFGINVYAILYSDGALIFQKGDEPSTSHGTVTASWKVTGSGHPWTDDEYKTLVKSVTFAEPIYGRTSAYLMFTDCSNLKNVINPENLDTSNIFDMESMFRGCSSLTGLDASAWDTSKVKWMNRMFEGCTSLRSFSNAFDTSSVTTMRAMFYNCNALLTLDMGTWNTENVTDMCLLFYKCSSLLNLNVTRLNMSKVTNAGSMFDGCSLITSLDLTNWNTSKISNFSYMFNGCTNLAEIKGTANLVTSAATNMEAMFQSDSNLVTVDMSNWDTSNVAKFGWLFYNCQKLETIDTSVFNMTSCHDIDTSTMAVRLMFYNCKKLVDVDMSGANLSGILDFTNMFGGCTGLKTLDITGIDMSSATTASSMFASTSNLVQFKINDTCKIAGSSYGSLNAGPWARVEDAVKTPLQLADIFTDAGSVAGTYEKPVKTVTLIKTADPTDTENYSEIFYLSPSDSTKALPVLDANPITGEDFLGWFSVDGKIQYTEATFDGPDKYVAHYDHEIQDAVYGVDLYMVRYTNDTDGTVDVYQKGNTPDPQYGTFVRADLVRVYNGTVYIGGGYTPGSWIGYANKAIIKDRITNLPSNATINFYLGTSSSYPCVWENLERVDMSTVTAFHFAMPEKGVSGCTGMAQWDTSNVTSVEYLFHYVNFDTCDIPDLSGWDMSKVTNMHDAFASTKGTLPSGIDSWDVSHVTDMRTLFAYSAVTDYSQISDWETSSVTNLYQAFYKNRALNLDFLQDWDTSHVTNMGYAFSGMTNLISTTGLSNWNTSAVTNMYAMFDSDTDLTQAFGMSNWDLSSLTDASYMFRGCTALKAIDLAGNPTNIATIQSMFADCNALENVDSLSSWTTPNLNTMYYMFSGCYALKEVDGLRNFNTSRITTFQYMFNECRSLNNIDGLANWDSANVTSFHYMFYHCEALPNVNALSDWNVSAGKSFEYMFGRCGSLTDITGLNDWSTPAATSFKGMFSQSAIKSTEGLSNFSFVSNPNTIYMFNSCGNLKDLSGLSAWDLSTKTGSFEYMFYAVPAKDWSPIADWDISGITSFYYAFSYAGMTDLTAFANWNTGNVTNMQYAFNNCDSLLDTSAIKDWDTSKVTRFDYMFNSCDNLLIIDMGGWDFSGVTDAYDKRCVNYLFSWDKQLIKIVIPESYPYTSNMYKPSGCYVESDSNFESEENFNAYWVKESDDSVSLLTDVICNFSADKADAYYRQYTLRFYPMGGTVDPKQIDLDIRDTHADFPTPVRDNYDFLGWYDSTGTQYTDLDPDGKIIKKLFARWSSTASWNLRLYKNYGTEEYVDYTIDIGTPFKIPANIFTRDGYVLSQWNTKSTGTGGVSYTPEHSLYDAANADETLILYARWEQIPEEAEKVNVNFHFIDTYTGDEIKTDAVTVPVGFDCNYFDHQPEAPKNAKIIFSSFSDDLAAATWDGTGVAWEENKTYTSTHDDNVYTYEYNALTEERANILYKSRVWTMEDDGTDVYVYCFIKPVVAVWFNKQTADKLPGELIMYVDGVAYREGEYTVSVDPTNNFNLRLLGLYGYEGNYPEYKAVYTPDYWKVIGYNWVYPQYLMNNAIADDLQEHEVTFNYPYIVVNYEGCYSCWSDEPNVYTKSGYTSTYSAGGVTVEYETYNTNQHYNQEAYKQTYLLKDYQGGQKIYDIYIGLDVQISYVGFEGTVVDQNKCYFGYYNPDPTQVQGSYWINFSNVGALPAGYSFEGWWTTPEGEGECIIPKSSSNFNYFIPLDVTSWPTPGTVYGRYRQLGDYEQSYPKHVITLHNDQHNEPVLSLVTTSSTFQGFYFYANQYYVNTELAPMYDSSLMFGGWYTEPNGQGHKISLYDEINSDMDIYAYWLDESTTCTIYFDKIGVGERPRNISNIDDPFILYTGDKFHHFKVNNGIGSYTYLPNDTVMKDYYIPFTGTSELYNFLGWFDDEGNQLVRGTELVNGTIYHARWESAIKTDLGAEIVNEVGVNYKFGWANSNSVLYTSNSYSSPSANIFLEIQANSNNPLPIGSVMFVAGGGSGNTLNTNHVWPKLGGAYAYFTSYDGQRAGATNPLSNSYEYIDNPVYGRWPDATKSSVVVNTIPLTGGYAINYNGGLSDDDVYFRDSTNNYYRKYPINVLIDADLDGTYDIELHKNLYTFYTSSSSNAFSSYIDHLGLEGEAYWDWPSNSGELGNPPADAGDYYYVRWRLYNKDYDNNNNLQKYGIGKAIVDYIRAVDSNNNGEVCGPISVSYNGIEYQQVDNFLWMRYPKADVDLESGRVSVTQTLNVEEVPLTPLTPANRNTNVTGTAVLRFDTTPRPTGNYVINMGRGQTRWNTVTRESQESKSFVTRGIDLSEKQWYFHEAHNMSPNQTQAWGMNGVYYNSGAPDDWYKLFPSTGYEQLTEDEYYISRFYFSGKATLRYYDPLTNTYTNELEDEQKDMDNYNTEVWVRYRNSDDWVKKDISGFSGMSSGYENYYINFGEGDTGIVDVELRYTATGYEYVDILVAPSIVIKNTPRVHEWVESDYKQETSSCFKIDGLLSNIDSEGNHSVAVDYYFSMNADGTRMFDENCQLTIYEITPDKVGRISMWMEFAPWNYNSSTWYVDETTLASNVDTTFMWYNRSTEPHDYRPFNTGVIYVLFDEGAIPRSVSIGGRRSSTADVRHDEIDSTARMNYHSVSPKEYTYEDVDADGNTITVTKQYRLSDYYTVEYVDDWQGSGRTMAIVRFHDIADIYEEDNAPNIIAITVDYDIETTDLIFGLKNTIDDQVTVLGVNTDVNRPAYTNSAVSVESSVRPYFADIINNGDAKSMASRAKYNHIYLNEESTVQYGFYSYVANSSNVDSYRDISIFPNENIRYRFIHANDELNKLDDLVFNITLDGQSTWERSIIPSISMKDVNGVVKVVNPTVWYCMTADPDFDNIDAEHGWSQEDPTGKTVYGVQVDYRTPITTDDFAYIDGSNLTQIFIYEKTKYLEEGTELTSQAVIKYNQITSWTDEMLPDEVKAKTFHDETKAIVEIPELTMTITSVPESGTEAQPKPIHYQDDLQYRVVVKNTEDRAITDVMVEVELPDGLHYDLSKFTIGGTPIQEYANVKDISFENNLLTYTIKSLAAANSVYSQVDLVINTYVDVSIDEYIISNHGQIVGYFGERIPEEDWYESNKTYHMVIVPLPEPTGFGNSSVTPLATVFVIAILCLGGSVVLKRRKKSGEVDDRG